MYFRMDLAKILDRHVFFYVGLNGHLNFLYFQPCVVFCGHPSLRFGDAVHFIEMWGNNPNNSIIFTGILKYHLLCYGRVSI